MKKKIAIAIAITTLFGQTVFADSCNYDVDNQLAKFSVDTDESMVSVIVKSDVDGSVIYVKELDAVNGKVSDEFGVPSSAVSGGYTVSVAGGGSTTTQTFRHINEKQATEDSGAIAAVAAASAETIKNTMITYSNDLGIDAAVLGGVSGDTVADLVYNIKPENLDAQSFYKTYNLALILKDTKGATNTVIDGIIKQSATFLGIDYSAFSLYSQAVKDSFYSHFSAATVTEPHNLDMVKLWLALSRFNNTVSWDSYKSMLLTDYQTILGIDTSIFNHDKSEDITRQIMNFGPYTNKTAIAGAYATACAAYPLQSGGGSGGGGGGGSSGGGGGSSSDGPTYEIPYVPAPQIDNKFSDMPATHWAKNIVNELAKLGIVNGDNGKFNPDNKITRAEFVTLIANAFYTNEIGTGAGFADVSSSDWFYKYVSILSGKGIVNGVGGGKFAPNSYITREDMAVIAQRCAVDLGLDLTPNKENTEFSDAADFASYSREAVKVLYGAGVISGMPDGTFLPKKNLSRAEAAVVIYGILNR